MYRARYRGGWFLTSDPVRLGVAGLGRAFMLMVPTFDADARVKLTAAAAPRAESRAAFEEQYGGVAYPTVEELCADPSVEAIYIATPHQMHVDHVLPRRALESTFSWKSRSRSRWKTPRPWSPPRTRRGFT